MRRFAPALRSIARELDLPRSTRAAILLEMAADLDAVYAHHRARGATEDVARMQAEHAVIGSGDVVRRLTVLHRDSWREWAAGVGSQLTGGMDLLLLSVGVAPVFLLALATSARALAQPATPAGLLLIVVGVALVALSGTEAFRHLAGARVRARRLSVLLLLTSMAPALGTLALLLGIHATSVLYASGAATAASVSAASEPAAMVSAASASAATVSIASTLARDGATFVLGACLGIGGLLAWFVLQSRASLQAIREVDDILAGRAHSPVSARTRGIIPLVKGWHA